MKSTNPSALPVPSPEAAAHSQCLINAIIHTIQEAGGAIPFADFMHLALYARGLGYYVAGLRKFGQGGDFVTAPEMSVLFGECLARQCQPILEKYNDGVILELGAGSGALAVDMLRTLAQLNALPEYYWILEVSPDLQQRQQALLSAKIPDLLPRVRWLTQLPDAPFRGIILANEVMDAMPVQRFQLTESGVAEAYVGYEEGQFVWIFRPTQSKALQAFAESLRATLPVGYTSEFNPLLPAWIQSLRDCLQSGLILLIDYGFPHHEFYHPQRHTGTLMCHYQHLAHTDPLILVGLQDITAHVDFTQVAEAAKQAGLHVAGYTNQANFLLGCGLPDLLAHYHETLETSAWLRLTNQAKMLVLPSEMGELFKVIGLTRQLNMPLIGFRQDERGRL